MRDDRRVPRAAHSFVREFDAAPAQTFCVEQHYLLCVSRGALRMEVDGTVWMLPPRRAALIRAGQPVEVTIPQPVTSSSVLVSPSFAPPTPAALSVFELSPLARSLLAECAPWGEEAGPLDDYSTAIFRALVAVTWAAAENRSPAHMPSGRSPELRRALALTESLMAEEPSMVDIARDVGLTPRSLARRFEQEIGMTWRAALRRLRVLRSIELLATTSMSVTEVAVSVGYCSPSAFNAAFRDVTDTTPSRYRASFAVDPPSTGSGLPSSC